MMSSGPTATHAGAPRSGGDFFSNIGNPLARVNSLDKLFSAAPLDDKQKNHLKYVYSLLTTGILFAAVGSYFHLMYNVGGLLTMFATMGLIFYLGMTKDPQSKDVNTRGLVFAGLCFLKGASIGPLMAHMIAVDSSLILMTLLATAGIFLSFSLAAIFAERRSMIFLGGILSSLCTVLFVSSLFNMFMHSSALFSFQLYAGLVMFSLYVIFDTQVIIEKCALGDYDIVWHATELFIDLVAIFVRVAIILLRNQSRKKRSDK